MTRHSWKQQLSGLALIAGLSPSARPRFASAPAGAAPAKKAVLTATVPGMGVILVDAQGHALYTHTDASGQAVACTDACATAWPPLTVAAGAKVKARRASRRSRRRAPPTR